MNRGDVFVTTMTIQRMSKEEAKARLNDYQFVDDQNRWEKEVPEDLIPVFGEKLLTAKTLGEWHKTCDSLEAGCGFTSYEAAMHWRKKIISIGCIIPGIGINR